MIDRKSNNSISFVERVLTAAIVTLLLLGYQRLFPVTKTAPSFIFDVELEQLPQSDY
ncbi:MAG: hypothetical protein QNJ41_29325 [Xenococcaceae cyanobacterium MO_188.B32]|nr:hypothetical protein [Xenococcaceae cyanobacterium MO_188.B32]